MIEYQRLAQERKKKIRIRIAVLFLLIVCLLTGIYFLCTVKTVEVTGNENFSSEDIIGRVLPSEWDYNTIYLLYKTHFSEIEIPPYLDAVEIHIVSYNAVEIQVYEKEIIGYVTYGGNYVYFDKDGVVLETSTTLKEGVPLVKGLSFDSMTLYGQLDVGSTEVFDALANLTQLLEKNSLVADTIIVTEDFEYNLLFGEVRVQLGYDENMENKIARLASIMTELEGRSGILYMEDVDESTQRITFEKTASE